MDRSTSGPTRRRSEREPADSLRDQFNLFDGWLPSLTLAGADRAMAFRGFPFNFHDGQLTDFAVGPRPEVTLCIALDPVGNQKQERTVLVRFGAIQDFDDVSSFLEKIRRVMFGLVLLAGGGFKHAGHLAFDKNKNYPLTHLYVSLLRSLSVETTSFSSGTGTMRGIEFS